MFQLYRTLFVSARNHVHTRDSVLLIIEAICKQDIVCQCKWLREVGRLSVNVQEYPANTQG